MTSFEVVYLGPVDIAVLVIYFVGVVATGLYAMLSSKRDTTAGYFLAGRFITFVPIGASLFASNMGAESFLGIAGSGAATGLSVGAFELGAIPILQLLGFLFVPVYLASGVITLPEYLQKRFGGQRISLLLSILSLVLYVLTKMSVNFFSGALFIEVALGWNLAASLALIIGLSAFCTISGGLAAVIYTDAVQAFLMVAGAMTLMGFGFAEIGGLSALYECYMDARPTNASGTCGQPRADSLVMMRDPADPNSDMPWPGFIFGCLSVAVWYWCADQVIVQRALSAKNLSHAQGATILAGYLKVLPFFMLVLPGMLARILYTDVVACTTPAACELECGDPSGCSNYAYPYLVMDLMPEGLRGLMVAVLLAALVTALTSIFNSASSLFTVDIYPLIRKNPSTREEMIVGRVFVVVMVVLSVLWIPLVQGQQGGQLFIYIQSVQSYLTPPIASVFFVAILWKRANEQGAFWALLAGLVTGSIGLILEFVYPAPRCGELDTRPAIIANVHYMYFSMIMFWGTIIFMVIVSLLTNPNEEWRTIRTVFSTRFDETVRPDELPEDDAGESRNDNPLAESIKMNESVVLSNSESPHIVPYGAAARDDRSVDYLSGNSSFDGKSDEEHVSCADRLDLPTKNDPETGEKISSGQMCKLWCLWLLGRFCGFSLNESTDESSTAERHKVIENNIKDLVSSLHQDKNSVWFLMANLVIILLVSAFMFIFFSLPPESTGILVVNSTNCTKF